MSRLGVGFMAVLIVGLGLYWRLKPQTSVDSTPNDSISMEEAVSIVSPTPQPEMSQLPAIDYNPVSRVTIPATIPNSNAPISKPTTTKRPTTPQPSHQPKPDLTTITNITTSATASVSIDGTVSTQAFAQAGNALAKASTN